MILSWSGAESLVEAHIAKVNLLKKSMGVTIIRAALRCGWPAVVLNRESLTVKLMNSPTTSSRTQYMCTTCTLLYCTYWELITPN